MVEPGAHIILVKAEGYKLFAHKGVIKPGQTIKVRVPLKPGENDDPKLKNA